jgi:GTP:adenosylcobinamide-phosphate guanylyltransferase
MKKFLAIGITTLGGFGLLGLGATAASAATIVPPTAHELVCTSAAAQLNSLLSPLAAANSAEGAASTVAGNAQNAVVTAEQTYVADALKVITDTDTATTPAPVLTADISLFNTSITDFVSAVVASSAANVTEFKAEALVTQLNLQQTVLIGLSAGC